MTFRRGRSIILMVALSACGHPAREQVLATAVVSLQTCIQTFADVISGELERADDRAYVRLSSSYISVGLTHGELGTFGERSPNFRPVLSCYLSREAQDTVIFMAVPGQSPLLGLMATYESIERQMGAEVDRGEVTEVLFLKKDGKYVFEAVQMFDVENIYRRNPAPQVSDDVIGVQ